MHKKAQISQVFVYILSIIMVLFIGFLVARFIFTFGSDVSTGIEIELYDTMSKDYHDVYETYGSEKVFAYKVPSQVQLICMARESSCLQSEPLLEPYAENVKESISAILESGDTIIMLDERDVLSSGKFAGAFNTEAEGGCFCIRPNNGNFQLVYENYRNTVYITPE